MTNATKSERLVMLPYKGKVGETRLKSLRNTLKSVMPANNMCKIIYTGTKLTSKFNIKDEISKKHWHDVIHKAHCSNLNWDETYIGEIGRRIWSDRDDKLLAWTSRKDQHWNVNIDHFEILSNDYKNNKFKENLRKHYMISVKDPL